MTLMYWTPRTVEDLKILETHPGASEPLLAVLALNDPELTCGVYRYDVSTVVTCSPDSSHLVCAVTNHEIANEVLELSMVKSIDASWRAAGTLTLRAQDRRLLSLAF